MIQIFHWFFVCVITITELEVADGQISIFSNVEALAVATTVVINQAS